jgi:hypothetical protein
LEERLILRNVLDRPHFSRYVSSITQIVGSVVLFSTLQIPSAFSIDQQSVKFFWQKVQSRGPTELNVVEVDGLGKGKFEYKPRGSENVSVDLELSPATINRLLLLFVQADFLNENKDFVSLRKVADLGMKTIRFEMDSRKREVSFNYTEDREVQQIVNFFENLCLQERILFEIELALKYDRLGIPKMLDELGRNQSSNRIVAPERFSSVLDRIYQDESLMNYARVEARKLLAKMQKSTSR